MGSREFLATRFLPAALGALMVLMVVGAQLALASDVPIPARVLPGYQPDANSKWDEQGIWMEMAEAEQQLANSPLRVTDSALTRYVEAVVCKVTAQYCDDVRVFVVKNPHFNASMAPNGTMIVHTGLLARVTSTDELAAVLGHELAHYTQAHSLRRFRAAKNRLAAGSVLSIGLALGGVYGAGLPELFAVASVMSFTRAQESQADELGAWYMNQANYDPTAAARVWARIRDEEEQASIKHKRGPLWLSSHPEPKARERNLAATARVLNVDLSNSRRQTPDLEYVGALQADYAQLMDSQVSMGDFGRLNSLLDRHEAMGIAAADIAFYRGEGWRIHRGAGDHERAIAAYQQALQGDAPNVRAYRELGYLQIKHGEPESAKVNFTEYLARVPTATDRQMIEFYIGGGW